jgi:uncharacterized Rmd1/YagE family protein
MPSSEHVRVFAYAVGVNVPVQELIKSIDLPVLSSDRKHVVFSPDSDSRRKPDSPPRLIVAFDFGALIFIGPPSDLETRAVKSWMELSRSTSTKQASAAPRDPTTEDFAIVIDPATPPDARFDRLIVASLTQPVAEIVAMVVGQSVAMEHLETEVDEILSILQHRAAELAQAGSFRASRKQLLQLIGKGIGLGHRAVYTLSILDPPLASWNDELLNSLHTGLMKAFGISERYRALDHKLTKVQSNLELLVNLIQSRRALVLELIVVLLILLEIILALVPLLGHGK